MKTFEDLVQSCKYLMGFELRIFMIPSREYYDLAIWYDTMPVFDAHDHLAIFPVFDAHDIHPKTLFEIAMVLSTNSGSFPSNSRVSVTFSILLRFGESWNRR